MQTDLGPCKLRYLPQGKVSSHSYLQLVNDEFPLTVELAYDQDPFREITFLQLYSK